MRAGRSSTQSIETRFVISSAQLYVLQTLADSPGMSVKDLVAVTLTTSSTVSEVVGGLVRSGPVLSATAKDDRRRKALTLTEGGREIVRHSPRPVLRELMDGFARLPAAEQRALADSLKEWCRLSGIAGA